MRAFLRLLALVTALSLLVYGLLSGSDNIWLAAVWAAALPIGYILFSLVPRQTIGWRRNAWKISAVLAVGFIVLSMQLLRQQFIMAPTYANFTMQTEEGVSYSNPRLYAEAIREQRGRIFGADGTELAGRQVSQGGLVRRTYPVPEASYLTGYFSPGRYGSVGLERAYEDYLSGEAGAPIEEARSRLLRRPPVGNDLYLTLDADLQRLGQSLLGDRRGAIVVMNPQTGAIRAMVSNPAYNAADLTPDPTAPREQDAARMTTNYNRILEQGDGRLLNRATRGLYSPGSVFKIVTTAAALDAGIAEPDDVYEDDGTLVVNGFVINDPNRPDEDRTEWTLAEGLKWSLNAVLAQVALDIETAGLRDYGRRFGFEREIPFDLPVEPSELEQDPGFLSDPVALASTGFGQGQLLVTPLQAALITATIANDGVMPRPYLVDQIRTPDGDVILDREPEMLRRVVSAETAEAVTRMMVESVESGTGVNARIPGVQVAGKTGTAQLGGDLAPHAWFTGFAPAGNPQVAVAVLLENAGEGAQVSAPIAQRMITAALQDAE